MLSDPPSLSKIFRRDLNILSWSLLQRSAEFHLPDISMSSLEALLHTVTQKLAKKRRGSDEGLWRQVQSDHLLMAVNEPRLRRPSEKMVEEQLDICPEKENRNNMYVCWVLLFFYTYTVEFSIVDF